MKTRDRIELQEWDKDVINGLYIEEEIELSNNENSNQITVREIKNIEFYVIVPSQHLYVDNNYDFKILLTIAKKIRKVGFEEITFPYKNRFYNADGERTLEG